MKKVFAFLLLITLATLVIIQACKKDNDSDQVIQPNHPPVAIAGNDTILKVTNCEPKVSLLLDGGLSYDPGAFKVLRYYWKQLSGPEQVFGGIDSNRKTVLIYDLQNGEYSFELEVRDSEGLSSKDSIIINVNGTIDYKELDLDLTGVFEFQDNVTDYYYNQSYDAITISGNASIANNTYSYYFYEYSDSQVISPEFINNFNLDNAALPPKFISGVCSVDFESLYIKGGGAFEGTIKVNSGSAYAGCENIGGGFPQIQISGNLNAATKTITMKLKGGIIL